MRKIKKFNPKISQTVFSFGCPCGNCSKGCDCRSMHLALTSWKVTYHQSMNRSSGGSLVGGAG